LEFCDVRDPRDLRGKRWRAQVLLETAVVTLMLLAKSLRRSEALSDELASGGRIPGLHRRISDSTMGDFLSQVSPADIAHHLHAQILDEHRRKALEPTVLPIRSIAIDGKTNATLDEKWNRDCQKQSAAGEPDRYEYRMVNVALISSAAAVCIDRLAIPASTNDMGVFTAAYKRIKRTYGRANLFELVSTDAGFTSENNARLVDDDGKAYWMALKGNQPELHRRAWRLLTAQSLRESPEAETPWELDSTRGWIRRRLWRTTRMKGFGKWSHLRQVVLIETIQAAGDPRRHHGPERILEKHFYLTNLPVGRLDGAQLIQLMRAHWRIENDFHGSLDIQWQEDHGLWVRRGKGLPVVGLLRAIAYNLLALMRTVHLRSVEARAIQWQSLRDLMRDAMLWPDLTTGKAMSIFLA
jgi:hypothetical protein